jgi:hypothetical protein
MYLPIKECFSFYVLNETIFALYLVYIRIYSVEIEIRNIQKAANDRKRKNKIEKELACNFIKTGYEKIAYTFFSVPFATQAIRIYKQFVSSGLMER